MQGLLHQQLVLEEPGRTVDSVVPRAAIQRGAPGSPLGILGSIAGRQSSWLTEVD
jgi:hypothetical protein